VSDLRGGGRRTDKATLLRFLRARKGNVSAAAKYFRQAELYRDELGLRQMETGWDLEAYERCFAPWWARGGIVGLGLKGQVVGWERFGRCAFPHLLQVLPWEVIRRLDAVHLTRVLAAFEEDSLRRSVPVGGTILVLDLEGLGWSFCTPKVVRAYAKLVQMRDMLLPCSLGHVFVIRAPKWFANVWSTFQHFLDPITREKVQIAAGTDQSLALLRSYIGDETIPAYLGGSLVVNGDPECRGVLGSCDPGPVPPEALRRLEMALAGRGKEYEQQYLGEVMQAKKEKRDSQSPCCFGCLERSR